MKAETVKYARTKNGETIEITARITDDRTAEDTLLALKGWTAAQFGEVPNKEELEEAERKIAASKYEKL